MLLSRGLVAIGMLVGLAVTGRPASAQSRTPYTIGPADVLTIVFWREKDLSGDVTVRPDGKLSLPLVNDVETTGLTPDQLRLRLKEVAGKFITDAEVSVAVKEIHSRTVYITGNVAKPGAYPMTPNMRVLNLVAMAGGFLEYADTKGVLVIQTENGQQRIREFNYREFISQKKVGDNLPLNPDDMIIVP
jgi:polysaccharide export outer membrane protein